MTGSGTLADPYVLWDVNDLQNVQLDLTAYYELGQDIDASATVGWNAGAGFIPIAPRPPLAVYFTGNFDGKGFIITDLFINRGAPLWESAIGLFGQIEGASISNVGLVDCDITGQDFIGGLVGWNRGGVVSNCYTTGQVSGRNRIGGLIGDTGIALVTITSCHSSASATGDTDVGGLVGLADEIAISECYATGNVFAAPVAGGFFGGLVGVLIDGIIERSYATGDVSVLVAADHAGGLVGGNYNSIIDCYARGSVTGNGHVGGLAGVNGAGGSIDNCYSTGAVAGAYDVGGLVGSEAVGAITPTDSFWDTQTSGQAISAGGTSKTTAQMKTASTFTDAGWDFATIWTICGGVNNDYPCLLGVTPSCVLAPIVVTPTVTTSPATGIAVDHSTLNGTLDDDGGEACDCGFEWGGTPALGNVTATENKNTGDAFSRGISGLTPGQTYYFRAFATNSAGTGYGSVRWFATASAPPGTASVKTLPATLITEHTARLNGVVQNDAGHWGYVRFQWGLTREYGAETPWLGGWETGDEFYADLSNLTEGMGYHFRAQFKNSGIVSGQDMVFNTLIPLGPVTLITEDLVHLLEGSL